MAHGLDQFMTGTQTLHTGSHHTSSTELLLQKAGVSPGGAAFINNVLSTFGPMAGMAIIRNAHTSVSTALVLTSEGVAGGACNRAAFERYKTILRMHMEKPHVVDPDLRDHLERIYRPNARIGSGSTAAAIRHELATAAKVGGKQHSQKGRNEITTLAKWLKNNSTASPGDRAAAENIIKDIRNALGE